MVGKRLNFKCSCTLPFDVIGIIKGFEISSNEIIFDVEVNGRTVIKDCDIYSDVGAFRPVVRKISVSVAEGEGLSVRFSASKGEPFLNAIRIWREL